MINNKIGMVLIDMPGYMQIFEWARGQYLILYLCNVNIMTVIDRIELLIQSTAKYQLEFNFKLIG